MCKWVKEVFDKLFLAFHSFTLPSCKFQFWEWYKISGKYLAKSNLRDLSSKGRFTSEDIFVFNIFVVLKTQKNVFNIFVFDLGIFKLKDKNVEDICLILALLYIRRTKSPQNNVLRCKCKSTKISSKTPIFMSSTKKSSDVNPP